MGENDDFEEYNLVVKYCIIIVEKRSNIEKKKSFLCEVISFLLYALHNFYLVV